MANIGLLSIHDSNQYYDITHSFKIDSFTYHILGLRKDRPTYANTYYIFNCGDCTQNKRTLPIIRNVQNFQHQCINMKGNARNTHSRAQTATGKSTEKNIGHSEQEIINMLKSEHQNLVESISKTIKAENKMLIRSIEESSSKSNRTSISIDQKLSDLVKNEQQTLVKSFREEIKAENEILLHSLKNEQKTLLETSSAFHKQEFTKLFDQHKRLLELLHEKQLTSINQSIEDFIERLKSINNEQHDSTNISHESQTKLTQTIEKQFERSLLISTEKFEKLLLSVTQLKTSFEEIITKHPTSTAATTHTNVDTFSALFAKQKEFITEMFAKQENYFSEYLQYASKETETQSDTALVKTNSNHVTEQHLKAVAGQLDQHLFKVSIKSPEPAYIFAEFHADGAEYPRKSHTLCQPDPSNPDHVTCYVAPPPIDGPYEVTIYAKTNSETTYRAAMTIRIPGPNISQSVFFPYTFPSFEIHRCSLIQPLRSYLHHNEDTLIHMVVPCARSIKIRNGNHDVPVHRHEYSSGVLKKNIHVIGDVYVYGQWNDETELPICFFYVVQ